jgi:phosphoglycolate phosphatase-like HAD superfamily hydrolase
MESAQKFVLFDFDGVIADSFALSYDVARIIHPETDLTPDGYRGWFEGNVYESIQKSVPGGPRNDAYFVEYASRMEGEVTLVPNMEKIIRTLATSYTLIIISSTVSAHIRSFLDKHALADSFSDVMGSDVHFSKVEKMRMVFEKYKTSPEECVFVTDTLGDIREAKKHEVGAIGVSWGWHKHETLEKGVPFRIVDTPAELPDAVDDYFARSAS